ncbi:MAG: dockerin type I repeat-containing protein [Clostridia bacterium]|nr:dockerin type I repeat-containing protein [Clostridia bacterium]
MKKRLLSLILCLTLVLALVPMGAVSAADNDFKEVPTSFTAPYIYVTSDNGGSVYVNAVHPEDLQRFIAYSDGYWGDAEGGRTNDDYWWTKEYGDGLRFDLDFQFDWRIPGGEWHYTEEWDTMNVHGDDNPTYEGFDWWGDISGTYWRVLRGTDCYNAEEGSKYYPLKDYFDEFFDGWDNYYLFDQTKTLEFRARYAVEQTSGYYSVEDKEEVVSYIFSDWSDTVSYGANNDASAQLPATLPTPTLEDLYIVEGEGYEGANLINFYAFSPFEMSYLDGLRLDVEETSIHYLNAYLLVEASVDGENWSEVEKHNLSSKEYYIDTCDVWWDLVRDPEVSDSWGDFVWYTQDVYLRARYYIDYETYDYTGEEVKIDYDNELFGNYSEVVKINVPGVNRYNITMDYINYGASDYATDSFTRTENEKINWICLAPLEGFWVQKVVVNDEVMFDLSDESTYELLDWEDQEQMARDYFKFKDDPNAWDDLKISVTYGGEAPTKHNLTYYEAEESTGKGYVNISAKGFYQDLDDNEEIAAINEGMKPTLTARAYDGSVIKSVTLDGNKLNVPKDATEYVYEMSAIDHAMDLVVEFEATSFSVYASKWGNGTVTVTAPEYYEEANEYVNKGDSATFEMVADEGYEILSVNLDDEEIDLTTLGKVGDEKLTSATYTIEDVQKAHRLSVTFSDEETQYVTLTVKYNADHGTCNGGDLTESVVKGGSCSISIVPKTGYYVAKIIDGENEITNFVGDSYYVRNLNEDRTVEVIFEQEAIPELLGDVNLDEKVNIKDATQIQKAVAKIVEFDEGENRRAEVTGDGKVNIKDATAIQKYAAKIETGFPIGEPI